MARKNTAFDHQTLGIRSGEIVVLDIIVCDEGARHRVRRYRSRRRRRRRRCVGTMRTTLTSSPGYLYDEHDAYTSFLSVALLIVLKSYDRGDVSGSSSTVWITRRIEHVPGTRTLLLDSDAEDWTLTWLRPFLRCFALKEGAVVVLRFVSDFTSFSGERYENKVVRLVPASGIASSSLASSNTMTSPCIIGQNSYTLSPPCSGRLV